MIADHAGPEARAHGFNSFEGQPEDWVGDYHQGRFSLNGLPTVRPDAVRTRAGWREHEYNAIPELVRARSLSYLALNAHERNVAVQICEDEG